MKTDIALYFPDVGLFKISIKSKNNNNIIINRQFSICYILLALFFSKRRKVLPATTAYLLIRDDAGHLQSCPLFLPAMRSKLSL